MVAALTAIAQSIAAEWAIFDFSGLQFWRRDTGRLALLAVVGSQTLGAGGFLAVIGRSPSYPEAHWRSAEGLAERFGVQAVRQVRMRWVGHRLEADVELDVDPGLSLSEAHRLAHDAEHELAHALPTLSHAIVHAYPGHEPALSS